MRSHAPSVSGIGWITGMALGPAVWIILLLGAGFFALAFLAYAGVCALVGGLLIRLLSRPWSDDPPGWVDSYRAAFFGYCFALMVSGLWSWATSSPGLSFAEELPQPETIAQVFSPAPLLRFLGWLWPGIPVAALTLAHDSPMYRGTVGLSRAVLLSAVSLPGSLIVPIVMLMALDQRLTSMGGLDDVHLILIAIAFLLALHAMIGGLLGAPVVFFTSRSLDPHRKRSLGRSYVTACLALLAWAAVTWVVMFFFPAFDSYFARMMEMAELADPVAFLIARPGLLLGAVATFGALQLPGVLTAALVVRARLGPVPRRAGDYARACAVSAVVAVVTWPMVATMGWLMAGS